MAASPGEAHPPDVHPLTSASPALQGTAPITNDFAAVSSAAPDASKPPDGGQTKCPFGALEDPHRGFVRCLAQGEKSPIVTDDADAGPSDSGSDAPSDGASPAPTASADASAPDAGPPAPVVPGPVPVIEVKPPKFENGDVPKAEKALSSTKLVDAIAKCVSDAGGLTSKTGTLKVEFLVRSRGKAEGVEIKPQGIPAEGTQCIKALFKNRTVGVPTADPTGVTVVYNLKVAGK